MDENRPKRSRVDDVLDLLDHATQHAADAAYPTDVGDPELCWRCLNAPGEGKAGVCAGCRKILLDETYAAPAPREELSWLIPVERTNRVRGDRVTLQRIDGDGERVGEPVECGSFTFTAADDEGWSDASGAWSVADLSALWPTT